MRRVGHEKQSHQSIADAADGVAIAYEDIGSGDPVVLLHGLTETRDCWREAGYVDRLLGLGRRVVLIDGRGHGASGKPREPDAYRMGRRVDDVTAVLDRAGVERAALIGHSMGGAIAIAVARHRPERVSALIVNGAHPFIEDMTPFRTALAAGLGSWVDLLRRIAADISEATERRIEANDLAAIQACIAEDRPDLSAGLAGLDLPVFAIAGTEDPRFDAVRRFAELTDGQFLPLEGRNHVTAFLDSGPTLETVERFFIRLKPAA